MRSLYLANVTVHVLAAMLWLGGMLFLGAVGAPVLRGVEPPSLRAALFARLGLRFRTVGWAAIGVLVVTGLVNLHFAGVWRGGRWHDPALWSSPYGHTLAVKLAAVLAMIAISAVHDFVHGPAASRLIAVHDFWLGPMASRLDAGTPAAVRARRRAALLARVNAIVGLVVVIAAVRLARGG